MLVCGDWNLLTGVNCPWTKDRWSGSGGVFIISRTRWTSPTSSPPVLVVVQHGANRSPKRLKHLRSIYHENTCKAPWIVVMDHIYHETYKFQVCLHWGETIEIHYGDGLLNLWLHFRFQCLQLVHHTLHVPCTHTAALFEAPFQDIVAVGHHHQDGAASNIRVRVEVRFSWTHFSHEKLRTQFFNTEIISPPKALHQLAGCFCHIHLSIPQKPPEQATILCRWPSSPL